MAMWTIISDILQQPTIWGIMSELSMLMAPLWVAVTLGVLVGWAWKPKWAFLGREILEPSVLDEPSSSSVHSTDCVGKMLPSTAPTFDGLKFQLPGFVSRISSDGPAKSTSPRTIFNSECSTSMMRKESTVLGDEELEVLYKLAEEKDDGPSWIQMMDKSTATMTYKAWRRDQENGPPQYRSSTIYENCTPEMARDFFWDDEFRMKWDDMLVSAETLEECPATGYFVAKWVRKFPFFCSDREYIIGRRIWESGRVYYCVTKGVPNDVPRQNKPRRVDLYYSSWCIRAVESRKEDGLSSACEVLLFHYEDMGIPWEIAKLGVRQGMWGAVKKIEPGLRAYQKHRASAAALSPSCCLAQITTKVTADYLSSLDGEANSSPDSDITASPEKPQRNNIPKLIVIGGAIALACTLDHGLLTKAVIFGVARRFANVGKRL